MRLDSDTTQRHTDRITHIAAWHTSYRISDEGEERSREEFLSSVRERDTLFSLNVLEAGPLSLSLAEPTEDSHGYVIRTPEAAGKCGVDFDDPCAVKYTAAQEDDNCTNYTNGEVFLIPVHRIGGGATQRAARGALFGVTADDPDHYLDMVAAQPNNHIKQKGEKMTESKCYESPIVPKVSIIDPEALALISTDTLDAYLLATGWHVFGRSETMKMRFYRTDDFDRAHEPTVPEPGSSADHVQAVSHSLDVIAERENRSALLVYWDILDTGTDSEYHGAAAVSGQALADAAQTLADTDPTADSALIEYIESAAQVGQSVRTAREKRSCRK